MRVQRIDASARHGRNRRHSLDLVGGDVSLGAHHDPGSLEQVGLIVAEFAQQDLQLLLGGNGAYSDRSKSTQRTRARSTWRKKS